MARDRHRKEALRREKREAKKLEMAMEAASSEVRKWQEKAQQAEQKASAWKQEETTQKAVAAAVEALGLQAKVLSREHCTRLIAACLTSCA